MEFKNLKEVLTFIYDNDNDKQSTSRKTLRTVVKSLLLVGGFCAMFGAMTLLPNANFWQQRIRYNYPNNSIVNYRVTNFSSQFSNNEKTLSPHSATSGVISLNYMSWEDIYTNSIDPINTQSDWSFTGTNPSVGIYVMAMDAANYAKFSTGKSWTYNILSNGSYYSASSSYSLPYSSEWDIVFYNNGSAKQSTTLTYSVTFQLPVNVPSSPLSLSAIYQGSAEAMFLSWNPPSSNGGYTISFYKIYRSTSSGMEVYLTYTFSTNYFDSGLTSGQRYYYIITAVNTIGEGPGSNETSAIYSPTIPSAPQSLSGSYETSLNMIYLTWSLPSSDGGSSILYYNIYRSTYSGSEIYLNRTYSTSLF